MCPTVEKGGGKYGNEGEETDTALAKILAPRKVQSLTSHSQRSKYLRYYLHHFLKVFVQYSDAHCINISVII